MSSIALVLPPGWTLHPGGPHFALPLLKGYLESKKIETSLHDLNIGAVEYFNINVSGSQICDLKGEFSVKSMNEIYFDAEDRLQALARKFDGVWYAHEGFRKNGCDMASPEDIRNYSQEKSPFTDYFKLISIPEIMKNKPIIIGITIIVPTQVLQAIEFVRCLRDAGYDGYIVLGGNVVTRIFDDLNLEWLFDLIDGVVSLQGEKALEQIFDCLLNNKSFDLVPNLMWRKDGNIVKNISFQLKKSDFEQPDYYGMSVGQYWGTNYLTMLASRGCYYGKCTFCAIPFGYGKGGYIGSSPAQAVVHSMKINSELYNINRFKFVDEAFHPKMMREMSEIIQADNLNFEFEAYLRLESSWTKSDMLRISSRAGLKKVYLGLELVPSEERNLLAKSDNANPLDLLNKMKDEGIKTHVFCMFGFPGTGLKEAFETVDFALKHSDLIDTLDIFPFYYARHTHVEGVSVIEDPKTKWGVEHKYKPTSNLSMPSEEVHILAERLGEVVWREHPKWFHPIYRMYSPWHSE